MNRTKGKLRMRVITRVQIRLVKRAESEERNKRLERDWSAMVQVAEVEL